MRITELEKHQYRSQLQWTIEENDDLFLEWQRTSALHRELVEKHGADGLLLWLEHESILCEAVYTLSEAPADCPWNFDAAFTTTDIIRKIFAPLENKIDHALTTLTERCRGLYAVLRYGRWYLAYVLEAEHEGQRYLRLMFGGQPLAQGDAEPLDDTNTFIPEPLQQFYHIHNGFGVLTEDGWSFSSILPYADLATLENRMQDSIPQTVYDVITWDFDASTMLVFYLFDNGSMQCFDLLEQNGLTTQVDDRMELTYEITDFFEFIDQRFSLF